VTRTKASGPTGEGATFDPRCGTIGRCRARFEEAERRLDVLAGEVSELQAAYRPGPGRWSIAECVDHVALTGRRYLPRIESALVKARDRGMTGSEPWVRGPLGGRMLLTFLDPSKPKKTLRAPKKFRPVADADVNFTRAVQALRDVHRRLLDAMDRAEGLDLGRVRFATPVSSLFRVSLAQAFEILGIHEHRHFDQADDVRRADGYPGDGPGADASS